MAFTTLQGFTPTQTAETANGVPNWGDSATGFQTPSGADWQNAFVDGFASSNRQHLSGVLSGGVCTAALLVVTVPANTYYVAGGVVWFNASAETTSVTDGATNYVWGCSDGLLRTTTTTTPPTDFEDGKACILTMAVSTGGVATLDNSLQERARSADYTNRVIGENSGVFAPVLATLPSGGVFVIPSESQYNVIGNWYNYGTLVNNGTLRIMGE